MATPSPAGAGGQDPGEGGVDPVALRPPREALDPRVRTWWRVHCLLWPVGGGLVLVALGTLVGTFDWLVVPGAALAVAGVVVAVALPSYWYRVHRWEVTGDAVYTRSGFLWQEWRAAPLSRIQSVDTSRGPLQQALGLSALVVTTASAKGAIAVVGLDHERAADLAVHLTRATQAVPGDAT